ncbi:MAG: bifunctional phosphopantothenoylcysteine decarboxylase/phosphopantothenate--cysteine ligase CoaBC [Ruminococcaceae bacterium]|nr:bifunctional phosphopantothenoylcysteine decarboxylase/phosphopantothenate--cysteine ligase CoaBC [Oscillospiraceae bacterium]
MLNGTHILLGVTGSIAAYKAADLVSRFKKLGAEVKVIMTRSATELIAPLTFQSLSQNPVYTDMFETPHSWETEHISLAKWADVLLVAPATANILAKLACGIADDMLSTVALATRAPILVAPAMNTAMLEHAAVQENIKTLQSRGVLFIEPEEGRLACGDTGRGKLAAAEDITDAVLYTAACPKDLAGLSVLVTAGATMEPLDPVRFLTNHSSGRMGIEIARMAKMRGASVTLVAGMVNVRIPTGMNVIRVESARDMHMACMEHFRQADIVIKAAAVADYRPTAYAENKIKKAGDMNISLEQNPDILAEMGEKKKEGQLLIGFCMETEQLEENAEIKLQKKNLDMIVANHLLAENAGFQADNNTVTILSRTGTKEALPNMPKWMVAGEILNRAFHMKQLDKKRD